MMLPWPDVAKNGYSTHFLAMSAKKILHRYRHRLELSVKETKALFGEIWSISAMLKN